MSTDYQISVSFYLMGNCLVSLAFYYPATIRPDSHVSRWWASKGPELQRPLNAGVALMGDEDQLQTVDQHAVCIVANAVDSSHCGGLRLLGKTIESILRSQCSHDHPHGRGCECGSFLLHGSSLF